MNFYQNILLLIEMNSFSNIWYWMILAVSWSLNSHFILGVPFDMVQRAGRRKDADLVPDLDAYAAQSIKRITIISERGGVAFSAAFFFCFIALAILGFGYAVELAQAVFLLLLPLNLVWLYTVRVAYRLHETQPKGAELISALKRHRMIVQGAGLVAITVTVLYGMVHNILNVVNW